MIVFHRLSRIVSRGLDISIAAFTIRSWSLLSGISLLGSRAQNEWNYDRFYSSIFSGATVMK